jgi:hypothetical protein
MESMGNPAIIPQSNVLSAPLHAHEEAPADIRSSTMAQQNQPNQPQQGNKPGQTSQQSSSDQHDQSANKK